MRGFGGRGADERFGGDWLSPPPPRATPLIRGKSTTGDLPILWGPYRGSRCHRVPPPSPQKIPYLEGAGGAGVRR